MDKGNKKQGYITVGELSVGFSENIIELTDNLVGREIMLNYESGKKAWINCVDTEVVKWKTEGQGREEKFICPYRAIMPRKNIYFVDFIVSYGDSQSVSVILDTERNIATVVTGILPTAEDVRIPLMTRAEKRMPLTSVQAIFEHAAIGGPCTETTPRHEKTTDLVGERFQWVYSSKDAYEHIYLNEQTYTWHCIAGSEKGLADTDLCFFYKIGEKLYLFVWIEKIIPTVGVVLEDLEAMRSYGKIFGYEGYDVNGRIKNFAVGSYGKWLNRTQYDFSRIEK